MERSRKLQPIAGLTGERLEAIARHLHLRCKGPREQDLLGQLYIGWACEGALSADDPTSLVTFDFMGLDEDRILSISGQVHRSPQTHDFPSTCRRIVGYVLAALDEPLSDAATGWLDEALSEQQTGKHEVDDVVFEFILHDPQRLTFDIHAAGF